MTQPMQPPAVSDHARHDAALIAALAAREPDLAAVDEARARDLVARCDGCRDLFADLVIIREALPATATPARPRDFMLTEVDARRLRPGGWRRVVAFFGSARDSLSRPLAIGFSTIGIVALVVTAAPLQLSALGGAGAASPALSTVGGQAPAGAGGGAQAAPTIAAAEPSRDLSPLQASAAPSAAASFAAAAPSAAAPAATDATRTTESEPYATGGETGGVFTGSNDTDNATPDIDADEGTSKSTDSTFHVDGGPSLGVILGGLSLLLGLGLFALRWTARRLSS